MCSITMRVTRHQHTATPHQYQHNRRAFLSTLFIFFRVFSLVGRILIYSLAWGFPLLLIEVCPASQTVQRDDPLSQSVAFLLQIRFTRTSAGQYLFPLHFCSESAGDIAAIEKRQTARLFPPSVPESSASEMGVAVEWLFW